MEYVIVIAIFVILFFVYEYVKNNSQNKGKNTIEFIVRNISEYIYRKNDFYNEIYYKKLKIEDRIYEGHKWLFFYDSISEENVQEVKRKGLLWGLNPQVCVKSMYIAFHYYNNEIEKIHIYFRNVSQYKFASEYIRENFKNLEKNNISYCENNNTKYPHISLTMENDVSLFITYSDKKYQEKYAERANGT